MKHLEGKVAIITGSSRGIGQKVAEQLAEAGASVVINYSKTSDKAAEVVKGIEAKGGKAIAIGADISKISDIEKLFQETISAFGKVDILVNNAGIGINKLMSDVTEEDFDSQFKINVKGTYFMCKQALKDLADNGRIVNISTSVNGQIYEKFSVYCATKAAVEQITRQTAKEFGCRQITINAVAPGPVMTELLLAGRTKEELEVMKNNNAMRRHGETGDIADVIEMLVSEKSHWISGQTIRANGGLI
jgi:3-oxoacyl-[acyl-carrier protein] reductase